MICALTLDRRFKLQLKMDVTSSQMVNPCVHMLLSSDQVDGLRAHLLPALIHECNDKLQAASILRDLFSQFQKPFPKGECRWMQFSSVANL